MNGGDLRTLLSKYETSKHRVGVDREKATIALHVCHALTYLHSLMPPVIHRDLKVRNILIQREVPAAAVMALSIRFREVPKSVSLASLFWFSAPDVVLGEKYDTKVDMFSFDALVGIGRPHSVIRTSETANSPFGRSPDFGHNFAAAGEVRVDFSNSSPTSLVELGCACVDIDPKNRPSAAEALYRLQIILEQDLAD